MGKCDVRLAPGNPPGYDDCWLQMRSNWKERFHQADKAFQQLKELTKVVPTKESAPEYRELANLIHTLGREVFYVNPDDYET